MLTCQTFNTYPPGPHPRIEMRERRTCCVPLEGPGVPLSNLPGCCSRPTSHPNLYTVPHTFSKNPWVHSQPSPKQAQAQTALLDLATHLHCGGGIF
jgi:hypothetical protein